MARLVGELVTNLAETPLLPLNVQTYGQYVMNSVLSFEKANGDFLQSHNVSLGKICRFLIASNLRTNGSLSKCRRFGQLICQ